MHNQPNQNCRVEYLPFDLPENFPVMVLKHSPSSETISYMHFHNCIELGFCYEGCGVFFINEKVLPFSAGDASIIFSNEIHIAQSSGLKPSQWKFVLIDPISLLSGISIADLNLISNVIKRCNSFLNIVYKSDQSEIAQLVSKIFIELENQENNYRSMVRSLVWSFMIKLARTSAADNVDKDDNYLNISRIAPALNYISENYIEPIRLHELAYVCKMSVTHFRRLFTTAMNIAPSEYIYTVKIKMASILLQNTEYSILEISMKVGYTTLSSFNRHFKRIMGVSPREWKKRS